MNALFVQVLRLGLNAVPVILIVLLARLLLRRAPKRFSYALWLIVFAALVLPAFVRSDHALRADVSERVMPPEAHEILEEEGIAARQMPAAAKEEDAPLAGVEMMADPFDMLSTAWAAGVLGFAGYGLISASLLRRRLQHAEALHEEICRCEEIDGALVFGFVHPRIYLPSGLSEEEQAMVICHERVHIRRHDHQLRLLAYALCCIYWFHPLVWLSWRLMESDMEMSCDEEAVRRNALPPGGYARVLLSVAQERAGAAARFRSGDVRSRIRNILKPPHWNKYHSLIVLLLIGALALLLIPLRSLSDPLAQRNLHYLQNLYGAWEAAEDPDDLLSKMDFGEGMRYRGVEKMGTDGTSVDGVPRHLMITLGCAHEDLSFAQRDALDQQSLKRNAFALIALQQTLQDVTYALTSDAQTLYLVYQAPDRSSKTAITDADSFTDFVQAYLMYDERGTAENDPSAYPSSDEAFAALQGMIPDEIWNKVDMESCSWAMSEDVLFRNHAYSAPVQIKGQTGRSWIRMSYEGQDLRSYTLDLWSFYDQKEQVQLSEAQRLQKVQAFVRRFRSDAGKLSFEHAGQDEHGLDVWTAMDGNTEHMIKSDPYSADIYEAWFDYVIHG